MKSIIWHKIFNDPKFNYNYYSKKLGIKNRKNYIKYSYKLFSIIYPEISISKFINIIDFQIKILRIRKNESIMDFGSGNGAFLYFFINKYKLKNNFSLEVSKPLLTFQKKIIKNTNFIRTDSSKLSKKLTSAQCKVHHSISNSVFQYFYSKKYALKVIEFLIKNTSKTILIYDIKNFYKKKKYIETKKKRQNLSQKEFIKMYQNTPLRFYKKKFFVNVLKDLNKKYNFSYKFIKLPESALDYEFGFNLLINKKY